MTLTQVEAPPAHQADTPVEPATAAVDASTPPVVPLDARRVIALVGLGGLLLVVAGFTTLYAVGPLVHSRDQRHLMATERGAIAHAVAQTGGLYGPTLPTTPPVPGTPVGILAVPALGVQQAVVEGVASSQTVAGPGHVPGTAGLGQPGNAAVVGRRTGYGGPFGDLAELRPGDRVVTATVQGQVVYVVRTVRTVTLVTRPVRSTTSGGSSSSSGPVHTGSGPVHTGTTKSATHRSATPTTENIRTLYGPSAGNQLTLVTSASTMPWNTDRAVVAVARMQGDPFAPTPQESRSPSQQGNTGEPTALAWLLLALLALVATLFGAIALYRRFNVRSAYLLSTAPLLALTVLATEAASHLLPAWL